ERISWQGHQLTMALVKNATGFDEVLRMLTAGRDRLAHPMLIAINDREADGRDISWLWDVDFERLATDASEYATTGLRGADMAARLHDAGIPADNIRSLPVDPTVALARFVDALPEGEPGY